VAYIKERLPIRSEMAGKRLKALYLEGFLYSGREAGFALAIFID